jgi:hypothetical protein
MFSSVPSSDRTSEFLHEEWGKMHWMHVLLLLLRTARSQEIGQATVDIVFTISAPLRYIQRDTKVPLLSHHQCFDMHILLVDRIFSISVPMFTF